MTIVVATIAPDVDGFGFAAELLTRNTIHPLFWWTDYHHVLAHNLLFACLAAGIATVAASTRAAPLSFAGVHLHLLGDVAGSRGPDGYQWPLPYFWPFSDWPQLSWNGQWMLNAWPNVAITMALLAMTFFLARRRGYSILGLVSQRADAVFVAALRRRWPTFR